MKKIIVFLAAFLYFGIAFSQNNFTLEIMGVKKHGGKLYISLFNSERSFEQRKDYLTLISEPDAVTVNLMLTLPAGEYLFSIYQDNNNNGELDTSLLGIPRELFGFSNYDGKSIPGSFKKHKVEVTEATKKIPVNLYKI